MFEGGPPKRSCFGHGSIRDRYSAIVHSSMKQSLYAATAVALALVVGFSLGLGGCSGWLARSEGIDPSTLPENLRADYAVFAQRCSKCHSLARPLSSGIDDDDYWAMYVARMRRQPASGISQEDTVVILRFLHYFSEQQKAKKEKHGPVPSPEPASSAAPVSSPVPMPASVPAPVSVPVPAPVPVPAAGAGDAG
jgi:hypothetical protein